MKKKYFCTLVNFIIRGGRMNLLVSIFLVFLGSIATAQLPTTLPEATYSTGRPYDKMVLPVGREVETHADAFTRAKVWLEPSPIEFADLKVTKPAPNGFTIDSEIVCKYVTK